LDVTTTKGSIFIFTAFTIITSANHSWNGYHWARTANPFTVKLGDNVSGAWDAVLATTSADWTQSQVLNTTVVAWTQPDKSSRVRTAVVSFTRAK
jgi:hypothetical protein